MPKKSKSESLARRPRAGNEPSMDEFPLREQHAGPAVKGSGDGGEAGSALKPSQDDPLLRTHGPLTALGFTPRDPPYAAVLVQVVRSTASISREPYRSRSRASHFPSHGALIG